MHATMPLHPSGRIVKTRKQKKGTLHQKNHRWESFTAKISKLGSLDPIRRTRRHDISPDDISTTSSYFKNGLEKWQDLNMSEAFIAFAQYVAPMSNSLPQILHFEGTIMATLMGYLEKNERESIEPLLELLTDFAHDLGVRFEKYYSKSLELVISIAGTPQDVEVVEWSFTCLAFLFKYLSKLLVPDLRPTYDMISGILGKTRQPPHIARFAAEAMSFLIRKSGTPTHRDSALPLIVRHSKKDLNDMADSKEFGLYYHGLMTMFAEAMKGNSLSIHTSGPYIFTCLLDTIEPSDLDSKTPSLWMNVIFGTLTSVVHHTSSETFKDLMGIILEYAESSIRLFIESPSILGIRRLFFSTKLIGIVAGVRHGTRVSEWPALINIFATALQVIVSNETFVKKHEDDLEIWGSLIYSFAITLQYAPLDTVIPPINVIMSSLRKDPLAKWFLIFSLYVSKAEPQRFKSLVLPYFQRFVISHWSDADNGDTLCIILPQMVSSGVLPSYRSSKDAFTLPQSWQDQIVSKFERLEVSPFPEQASPAVHDRSPTTWHDRCLPKYNALLEVLDITIVHPSTNARIAEILLRKLKLALRPSSSLAPEEAHFIVGRGFTAFSRMTKAAGKVDRYLEPLLHAAAPRYARLTGFLEALLSYEINLDLQSSTKSKGVNSDTDIDIDLLIPALTANLSTDSHHLRLLSLQLLQQLHHLHNESEREALTLMIMIEQAPLDLQTARSTSMHLRKLATLYSQVNEAWVKTAISKFCFGMLTVKLAQIIEDATAALKQISETQSGEQEISTLLLNWLEVPSVIYGHQKSNQSGSSRNDRSEGLTDFECSNLINLNQLADDVEFQVIHARDTMLQKFEEAQTLVDNCSASARNLALKVLLATPRVAEKHARQLVPMFLSWASKDIDFSIEVNQDHNETTNDWKKRDQKALLDLFGFFVNPKSLYRSAEVYNALLKLLENGDNEVQKAALKAIFTWKNINIKPYEENLMNLLDEARFKDEITILLQGRQIIQEEHRPQLMPVLLRLLYGRTISRKKAASGANGMEARRLIVLRNLDSQDFNGFLEIALGDLRHITLITNGVLELPSFDENFLSPRKQVGFTKMMEIMLKELGSNVFPFTQKILDPILLCLIYSCRQLRDDFDESEDDIVQNNQTSLLKTVRQTSLKCLILLFSNSLEFDWSPYIHTIIGEVVSPRLGNLPVESAQGISTVLRLLFTWSSSSSTTAYLGLNDKILSKIAECVSNPTGKDEVKLYSLQIIRNIVEVAVNPTGSSASLKQTLLVPNIDHILKEVGGTLRGQQNMSKYLLEGCVETVSKLAPCVSTSPQAHNLVDIAVFLLDQPLRRVNPKTKAGLLLVLEHFVPLYDLQNDPDLKDKVYKTITSLFGFFKDRSSREVLSRVLQVYAETDPVLANVADLCLKLNSFVPEKLDEPAYDIRLKAFIKINGKTDPSFTARQWTPLLFNMLYYIKHDEEFGILSSNASDSICHFVDTASESQETNENSSFRELILTVLVPALFSGMREPSEVIRRELVKVMAHLVRSFPEWSEFNDMHSLLAGDDELESSFFNNILTAGKGRQSSALGKVSTAAERGELSGKNVSHFFIPLIEHFVFDRAEGNEAHNLAAEATITIGILAGSLEWSQYRAVLRRYIGYIEAKPDLEKQIIRLLGRIIEPLAAAVDPISHSIETSELSGNSPKLSKTLPGQKKLTEDLTANFLPPLKAYLHHKDDSTVSLRVPVAVIVVKLLKLLPIERLNEELAAVLTDVCHILRSKAQESRDMTRDTLTKICVLLGPSCFGFVLKELRGALARGYQLHVLSYTVHSILVACTPHYVPGDLDYCLSSVVAIIMDDIFGVTGQEKDAEEYVSKMKEVRSSKSHDSMELVATTVTLSKLTNLIQPIQTLLNEKLNIRMVRKIDELLNRISSGLLKNRAVDSQASLVFCYEIIQSVYQSKATKSNTKEDTRLKRFLIQSAAKKSGDRGTTTTHTYKLVRFAFDVLRIVLKKHENLRTANNLAGFIPILGDSLVQGEEEVKIAAFRLLITIAKVPLKPIAEGTNLYRVAASEASKCISGSSSTTSDISQASLKMISVILRDRRDVLVKDTMIDDLLTRIKDDLTEPDRRHITFNFLRAVLDSKIETAVVYDTLDHVGVIMVTNDDKDTRDLARGAYFQFLRDYPQKQNRWSKQLGFIVANLKYEREGGRLSILEVIHLLLSKSSNDFVQEVSGTCFVPLVFVLANDDSHKCRLAASEVLKEMFQKADRERVASFRSILKSWMDQVGNSSVLQLAFQTYRLYFEARPDTDGSEIASLIESIEHAISPTNESESDWEVTYASLQLAVTLCENFPKMLLSSTQLPLWTGIRSALSYPHAWVKLSAIKLIGVYLGDFAQANQEDGLDSLPLHGSGGLLLNDEDLIELISRISNILQTPGLTDVLAAEVTKTLVFLGCCAGINDTKWKLANSLEEEEEIDLVDSSKKSATDYIFRRLSFFLRKETTPPRAEALVPKKASIQILRMLCNKLDKSVLLQSLQVVLLPLHNFTDSSVPIPFSTDIDFREGYQELKSSSEDIMESLKHKLGTQVYTDALLNIREGVKARRMERSSKRKIDAISQPEKFGESKRKKGLRKKERRKEKGQEHSMRRNNY